ncbi:ionotropic receptor 93a [Homalodisca vitripennis]|uniref:ionotropic receptor 93a n=1 Tax=Homalodisca vitripennis TaxID=197043 RepID=UPI001EEB1928|nr:ionotropic receptor 93a [Homalodisca vitripennis]
MQSLVEGLDMAAQAERDKSSKVSEEEWEQIKPSKVERKNTLLQFIKKKLRNEVNCDNCTMWRALTAELWGQDYDISASASHLLEIGYWNPREGCSLSDQLFPHSKYGFRQLVLPIASFHFPPWQIINYNSTGHAVEFKGVVFEIVDFIAKKFNFTYNVITPVNETAPGLDAIEGSNVGKIEGVDSKLEIQLQSMYWERISNLIREKKIFLGACALTITENKATIVNFTEPVSIETYVFLVSRPKELSRALLFILPFTPDAWFCIVSSIALMAPTLYIIHRLSPFYNYHGVSNTTGLGKISNCFWYVYGALLQQGGTYLPMADSGRLIIGTWWIVVLVVVTTYCGNLVAFLTFPKMDKVVASVHDLLERKDMLSWGIPDESYIKTLLMAADDPMLQEVYSRMQLHKELTPAVIQLVRDGRHAYIQSKTRLLYVMKSQFHATNTCDFSLGSEEFMFEKLGMIVSQDNPYLELFNKEIGKMHRMGLIHKWMTDYLPSKDRCWNSMYTAVVNNHTVNLDDMQGSFFILFLGIFLSFIIILLEFLVKRHKLGKEQRVIQPFVQ